MTLERLVETLNIDVHDVDTRFLLEFAGLNVTPSVHQPSRVLTVAKMAREILPITLPEYDNTQLESFVPPLVRYCIAGASAINESTPEDYRSRARILAYASIFAERCAQLTEGTHSAFWLDIATQASIQSAEDTESYMHTSRRHTIDELRFLIDRREVAGDLYKWQCRLHPSAESAKGWYDQHLLGAASAKELAHPDMHTKRPAIPPYGRRAAILYGSAAAAALFLYRNGNSTPWAKRIKHTAEQSLSLSKHYHDDEMTTLRTNLLYYVQSALPRRLVEKHQREGYWDTRIKKGVF